MLILLALLLRLLAVLAEDHAYGYVSDGSDGPWYLAHGYALVTGFDNGRLSEFGDEYDEGGVLIVLRRLSTPPLYLLFNGLPQAFFPREAAVLLIRVFQAMAGTISVWLVWRLGRAVTVIAAGLDDCPPSRGGGARAASPSAAKRPAGTSPRRSG